MVWGQIAAAAVPAATELIGSFFGKDEGPGFNEQKNHNAQMIESTNHAHMKSLVSAAKRNGIHPLAALGVSPQSGSISYSSPTESNMGQNLGRAAASLFKDRKNEQLQDLAIERAELENDMLRSQITNVNRQAGDAPNPQTVQPSKEKQAYNNAPTPVGYAHGTKPFYQVGIDPQTKKPFRVYNEDLGDNEVLQAITAIGVTIPDIIHGRITQPLAAKLRKVIKSARTKKPKRVKSYKYGDRY